MLLAFLLGPAELFIIVASIVTVAAIVRARARSRGDEPPEGRQASTPASAASVVVLVLLTLIGAWLLLPGLFDGNSRSLLGSKSRRSPIADIAGPRDLVDRQVVIQEDMVQRFHFSINIPSTVSVSVSRESGPQFDVFLMDEQGYAQWARATERLLGGEYSYFFRESGTEARRSVKLEPGNYVLAVDNSDFGEVSPPMNMQDDVLTAYVRVTVQ